MAKILTRSEPETNPGPDTIRDTIDPEIRAFEQWFNVPQRGKGPLTGLEKEILRAYLWWKLTGGR